MCIRDSRDTIYVWYSLFLLVTCLHFLRLPEMFFQLDWWLPNRPTLRIAMSSIVELAMQFLYMQFFVTLLELPRYQPRLWRWYRYLLALLAMLFLVTILGYLYWGIGPVLLVYFSRPGGILVAFMAISMILLAGLALRGQHALWRYAFVGLLIPVSYTHLDVYKRQTLWRRGQCPSISGFSRIDSCLA